MAYLKDIKLCVNCRFYGNNISKEFSTKDRCVHPAVTVISLVDGNEEYPFAFLQRRSELPGHCGANGVLFINDQENNAAQERRRQEFEEAMRDSPF